MVAKILSFRDFANAIQSPPYGAFGTTHVASDFVLRPTLQTQLEDFAVSFAEFLHEVFEEIEERDDRFRAWIVA